MRRGCAVLVFLAAAPLAFGQLDSNSIEIAATRSVNLQADQVVFAAAVNASIDTGLDQIVAALPGSGITAANLTGVYTPTSQPGVVWTFTLSVPFSKMQDTVAAFTSVQKNGLGLQFNVLGTQVSTQLLDSQQCPLAELMGDARARAQRLAAAAGLSVGPVLAVADGESTGRAPAQWISVPTLA